MAAKETSSDTDVSKREEFSDFALILKDGQELKCHKVVLAKVSPFFCAMLRQGCVETETNKMKVTEFEPDTVESLLDYIYAELVLDPVHKHYQRNFDEDRLTPVLLRMSHMYQIINLQDECVKHLMENIEDTNAVDIWSVAETIGHVEL